MEGARSSCEFTGITFAGATQDLDTGCKVVMNGPDTTATVNTKSISKDGGINTFRSSVVVLSLIHIYTVQSTTQAPFSSVPSTALQSKSPSQVTFDSASGFSTAGVASWLTTYMTGSVYGR